jgi:hypothetical protein
MRENHRPSITESDLTDITSNLTSASARTAEARSDSQTTQTGTSSRSSQFRSSIVIPPLSTFDMTDSLHQGHDHLIDSGKGSSLLTGTSFDALMNSLKSMREKDLDFLIQPNDDTLIRVND